jgi:hypothetical protein
MERDDDSKKSHPALGSAAGGELMYPRVFMIRFVAVAFALACLATSAGAQSPEMPTTSTFEPAPKRLRPRTEAVGNQAEPTASGRCELGIIPIAGNQFAVQKVGFGTFGSETTRIRVDGWGFDDLVAARVRAAAPGHAVRRIVYARKELARYQQGFPDTDDEINDFVRDAAAGTDCERYVVVQPHASRIMKTSAFVHGMGIVNVGAPITRHNFLFALTYIRIYDGRSFELIKQGATSTDDQPPMSQFMPFQGPKMELDEASFPATPSEAAANPVFRKGVRALLKASLDNTLPAMLR